MGYKIKEMREEQNMTQEELARKIGVSRTTIWALENNANKMASTKTMLKIAQSLGKSVDQIFLRKCLINKTLAERNIERR